MKRITLLIGVLVFTITSNAQNFYDFSKNSATYQDLTDATVISNGVYWNFNTFFVVGSAPFTISIFDYDFTGFDFINGSFVFFDEAETSHVNFVPFSTFLIDRNFLNSGAGLSPISYKVDGVLGNRILKLEVKNAGLSSEFDPMDIANNTSTFYLNYQIWFYEADATIEYRFGPNNITAASQLNFQEENFSQFYANILIDEDVEYLSAVVNGSVANPTYSEAYDDVTLPSSFDLIVPEGTVFRFAVNALSTKDKEKVDFAMYPNPTSNVLNLTFSENLDKNYSVYDLLGREVLKGKFDNTNEAQISVENLQVGAYILRIGGSTKKFIKK